MPLCTSCRSEAIVTTHRVYGKDTTRGGRREETHPPHGLEWGESCDECDNSAEVVVEHD